MQQYQDQKGNVFYLLRSLSTKMPLCTQLFPTYINTYKVVLYVKESSLNGTSMEISIINLGGNLMINVRVIEPAFLKLTVNMFAKLFKCFWVCT